MADIVYFKKCSTRIGINGPKVHTENQETQQFYSKPIMKDEYLLSKTKNQYHINWLNDVYNSHLNHNSNKTWEDIVNIFGYIYDVEGLSKTIHTSSYLDYYQIKKYNDIKMVRLTPPYSKPHVWAPFK